MNGLEELPEVAVKDDLPPESPPKFGEASQPTPPPSIKPFVDWKESKDNPTPPPAPADQPDLSAIKIIRPDTSEIKKVETFKDVPKDDHNWMQLRASERLLNNEHDERAQEVLDRQRLIGWLPDDQPVAATLPQFDSGKPLGIKTGVSPKPLSLNNENEEIDRYIQRTNDAAKQSVQESAKSIIHAYENGEINLPDDYTKSLHRTIHSDTTPGKELSEWWEGVKSAQPSNIASPDGFGMRMLKGAGEFMRHFLPIGSDEDQEEENNRFAQSVVADPAQGAARFLIDTLGLGLGGINAVDIAAKDTPEARERWISKLAQISEGRHAVSASKKTLFHDAEEGTPMADFLDFAGTAAVPGIGVEGAITKPISKLASAAVEKAPAVIGRTLQATGKTLEYGAPAIVAEELYRHGFNPIIAAGALAGYPFWMRWKERLIAGGGEKLAYLGKFIAEKPEGVVGARYLQNNLDKEISYAQRLQQDMRSTMKPEMQAKADDLSLRIGDIPPEAQKLRQLGDNVARWQRYSDYLDHAVGLNKVLRDGTKLGLTATGLTLATGPVVGAFAASEALPGEIKEAAKRGTETGWTIGAPGSLLMAYRGFNAVKFDQGRAAMAKRGENLIPKEVLDRLTPEQQQYAKVYAGAHDFMGSKLNIVSKDEAAEMLGVKPEEVPNGWVEGNQSFVLDDKLPSNPHEFRHQMQRTYGELLRNKDPATMSEFGKQYDQALKQSGIDRSASTQEERDAEVGRILLQDTPIEMFYGGESGFDWVKRRLSTFLADKFPKVFDQTKIDPVLGAPWSASDLNEMRAQMSKFGEDMALGSKPSDSANLSPEHQQAVSDAVDQLNFAKRDPKNAQKVIQALQAARQQGIEINARNMTFYARYGRFPKEATTQKAAAPKPSSSEPPAAAPVAPMPAPAPPVPVAAQQVSIAGPALVDEQGALVGKGEIGHSHKDVMESAIKSGVNPDYVLDAFSNDAQHVFVTSDGRTVDRATAGQIADEAGQRPEQFKGAPLQSEHLVEQAPSPKPPVPESIKDFVSSRPIEENLPKEQIAELHRAMDRGEIKNDTDLHKWIEGKLSGPQGEALKAIKTLQDSQQPFTGAYVKADGTLRTMNGQFGVQKGLKGGVKSTAGNPDLYTYYDHDAKGYRTFDINRLNSLQGDGVDFRASKKYMPKSEEDEGETEPAKKSAFMRTTWGEVRRGGELVKSFYDEDQADRFAQTRRSNDPSKSYEVQPEGSRWSVIKYDKKFMPRTEKNFSETIDSPAIRVNDITFKASSWGEAEKKARAFGYTPAEIKAAQKGFVSRKGQWLNPDEAAGFTTERKQMGKQQEESPLSVQAFNRWRKFQPSQLPQGWEIKPLDQEQKKYALTGSNFGAFNPEGELVFSGPTQEDVRKNIDETTEKGTRKFMPGKQDDKVLNAINETPIFKQGDGIYGTQVPRVRVKDRGKYLGSGRFEREEYERQGTSEKPNFENPLILVGERSHFQNLIDSASEQGHDGVVVLSQDAMPKEFKKEVEQEYNPELGGKSDDYYTIPNQEQARDFVAQHPGQIDWTNRNNVFYKTEAVSEQGQPLFQPKGKAVTQPVRSTKPITPPVQPERKKKKKSRYTIREKASVE